MEFEIHSQVQSSNLLLATVFDFFAETKRFLELKQGK